MYFSTIDALSLGDDVKVILDATRGIAPETVDAAVADMTEKGATIVNSTDLLSMERPSQSGVGTKSVGYSVGLSLLALVAVEMI